MYKAYRQCNISTAVSNIKQYMGYFMNNQLIFLILLPLLSDFFSFKIY